MAAAEGGTGYVSHTMKFYHTRLILTGNQALPYFLNMDTLALRLAEGERALRHRRETFCQLSTRSYTLPCEQQQLPAG